MIKIQSEAAQLALKNWGANFMCQPGSSVESKAPELGLVEVVELVGLVEVVELVGLVGVVELVGLGALLSNQ